MVLYDNRVSPSRVSARARFCKRKVQIARTASDADTLATTIRYAANPDRRSCGERQDFVTISTNLDVQDVHYDPYDVVVNADPYPTFARLPEEAPMNLVTSQAFRFPSTRALTQIIN
jgi:hypothetical protein